jgi:hypothetical protein
VLQRHHIQALASRALCSVLTGAGESGREGLRRELTAQESQLLNWRSDVFDGQWGPGPIPKLTHFTYWNRLWEVKVSNFPFMGWGLFALQSAKAGEELLPFSGRLFTKSEVKIISRVNPRFTCYVLQAENNVYQDGDVLNGNVAGFINSSAGREYLCNVLWEYSSLPRPWKSTEWGYTMTIAVRDIAVGDELFASYPVNMLTTSSP